MLVVHSFQIHGFCPFAGRSHVIDYYTVDVKTSRVVDVHEIEKVIVDCSGRSLSQEAIACLIAEKLRSAFGNSTYMSVTVSGRHSQNSGTVVTREPSSNEDVTEYQALVFAAKQVLQFIDPVFPPSKEADGYFDRAKAAKSNLIDALVMLGEEIKA